MPDEAIIHVSVEGATAAELRRVRDWMKDALEDYDGHGKIVVSDDRMALAELPSLDDYADELADRVAERMQDSIRIDGRELAQYVSNAQSESRCDDD